MSMALDTSVATMPSAVLSADPATKPSRHFADGFLADRPVFTGRRCGGVQYLLMGLHAQALRRRIGALGRVVDASRIRNEPGWREHGHGDADAGGDYARKGR